MKAHYLEARAIGRPEVAGPRTAATLPPAALPAGIPDLYSVEIPAVVEQIGRPPARPYPARLSLVLDATDVANLLAALEAAGWQR